MIKFLNELVKKTNKMRREQIRKKLINYYDTINQGQISIPSFMLADMAIDKKFGAGYGK